MAERTELSKAYAKGYYAATRNSWPAHRPPVPPHQLLVKLWDAADGVCATLSEDDDFVQKLGPAIDRVDESFGEITAWLTSSDAERTPQGESK